MTAAPQNGLPPGQPGPAALLPGYCADGDDDVAAAVPVAASAADPAAGSNGTQVGVMGEEQLVPPVVAEKSVLPPLSVVDPAAAADRDLYRALWQPYWQVGDDPSTPEARGACRRRCRAWGSHHIVCGGSSGGVACESVWRGGLIEGPGPERNPAIDSWHTAHPIQHVPPLVSTPGPVRALLCCCALALPHLPSGQEPHRGTCSGASDLVLCMAVPGSDVVAAGE